MRDAREDIVGEMVLVSVAQHKSGEQWYGFCTHHGHVSLVLVLWSGRPCTAVVQGVHVAPAARAADAAVAANLAWKAANMFWF